MAGVLLFFAGVWAVAPQAHAGTLTVALHDLPCPASEDFARAIEARAQRFMSARPDATLVMSGKANGTLVVRLLDEGPAFEKAIQLAPEDCPVLASTVTLLVRSWFDLRLQVPVGSELAVVEPKPAAAKPTALEAPVAVEPLAPVNAVPAESSSTRRRGLLAIQGGLAAVGGDTAARPLVAVAVEPNAQAAWGFVFSAQYRAPLSTARVAPGQIAADLWHLGGRLRWLLPWGDAARIDLGTGPTLEIVSVRPSGYPTLDPGVVYGAAWTTSLRARLELGRGLWALATVEASLRPGTLTVKVDDQVALALKSTRVFALAGVAWGAF